MYLNIYIYICTYVPWESHSRIGLGVYLYIHICIYIYIYIHVSICIYIQIYTYIHICIYKYTPNPIRLCDSHSTYDTHESTNCHMSNSTQCHIVTDSWCSRICHLYHMCESLACTVPSATMGWLRSVGSVQLCVSFAEYCLFCRALL